MSSNMEDTDLADPDKTIIMLRWIAWFLFLPRRFALQGVSRCLMCAAVARGCCGSYGAGQGDVINLPLGYHHHRHVGTINQRSAKQCLAATVH